MHTYFCHIAFILALCLVLVSCGPAPQTGKMPPIPSANRSQPAASTTGALPASATVDVTKKPLLKTLFRDEPNVNRLEDLYGTTRGKVENLSIVSNCDLAVLKAFVATGWAPIIRSRGSGKGHLSAVMGYDDANQQIQIGNPLAAQGGRRLAYSDFEKEWATGSGRTCVLITPKKLCDVEIRAALKKYLSEEQVAGIQVRSR